MKWTAKKIILNMFTTTKENFKMDKIGTVREVKLEAHGMITKFITDMSKKHKVHTDDIMVAFIAGYLNIYKVYESYGGMGFKTLEQIKIN